MKVKLEGNHSSYHGGCAAVWSVLEDALVANGCEITRSGDYEALVINGEGSMHHGRPTFHRKMQEAKDALTAGKQVYLVNSVWEDNPGDYDAVLASLSGVSVRETLSANDLFRRHNVSATVCPDFSYFLPVIEADGAVRSRQGEAYTDYLDPEIANFVAIPSGFQSGREALVMSDLEWNCLVKRLRSKELLVTGRHHAVYAAIRARTPFAAIEGNSHKISGLIEMTGVKIPVAKCIGELEEVIGWARENMDAYNKLFDRMTEIGQACDPRSVLPSA